MKPGKGRDFFSSCPAAWNEVASEKHMPFLHLSWKTLLWLIENIDAGTEGITLSFVSANSSQQNPAGGFRGLGLFLK